mgnify:CR=1 FL=1
MDSPLFFYHQKLFVVHRIAHPAVLSFAEESFRHRVFAEKRYIAHQRHILIDFSHAFSQNEARHHLLFKILTPAYTVIYIFNFAVISVGIFFLQSFPMDIYRRIVIYAAEGFHAVGMVVMTVAYSCGKDFSQIYAKSRCIICKHAGSAHVKQQLSAFAFNED